MVQEMEKAQQEAAEAQVLAAAQEQQDEDLLAGMNEDQDAQKPFVQTEYLYNSLDGDDLLASAPDKTVDEDDGAIDTSSGGHANAAKMMISSVIDVQRDINFAMVVDPSLIFVNNTATGGSLLTVDTIMDVEQDYF